MVGVPFLEMEKAWSLSMSQWSPVTPGSSWLERRALSLIVGVVGEGCGLGCHRGAGQNPTNAGELSTCPAP